MNYYWLLVVDFCSAFDQEPQEVDPTPFDEIETSSTVVGGELNRWYNITSAEIVAGADDPSFGDSYPGLPLLREKIRALVKLIT